MLGIPAEAVPAPPTATPAAQANVSNFRFFMVAPFSTLAMFG